MPAHVVVVGPIASGKSTVCQLLSEHLKLVEFPEEFAENAFLERFYTDMPRWALHSQLFFLSERAKQYHQIKAALDVDRSVVIDSPIQQNAYTFALAQERLGNMEPAEWQLYESLFQLVSEKFPPIDLVISLEAPVKTLRERIRTRGRQFEQDIPKKYLELMHQLNQEWVSQQPCQVLRVNVAEKDLLTEDAQNEFLKEVRALLGIPGNMGTLFSGQVYNAGVPSIR